MKKHVLTLAAALLVLNASAQKSNIRAANNYLASQEYDKAKKAIDEATTNESTANDPHTWYLRGEVYLQLQNQEAFKAGNPYREAATAYMKAATLGAKDEELNKRLTGTAFYYFNDGAAASKAKDWESAYNYFGQTIAIHDMEGGARFKGDKQFDTVASDARLQRILAAERLGKTDELVSMLEVAKNDPINRQAYLYHLLFETYGKLNQTDKAIATIAEGRRAYPADANLRNDELNYYIKSGKSEELLKKLEEAAAAEPTNAELQFNLASTYYGAAVPKSGTAPANAKDILAKAETAYGRAIALKGDVPDYQYNAGVLYYNQAVELNKKMNAISGTSTAEVARYNAIKKERDAQFGKALPYFEKAATLAEAKGSSMSQDDKITYQSSLYALQTIYASISASAKAAEIKKKLDALK
jgi:hypothetical protein